MNKTIKDFFAVFATKEPKRASDFSDFFSKPDGDKAKVIRRVMREANEEQRKMVQEYHKQLVG